jgi:hypothetical protein
MTYEVTIRDHETRVYHVFEVGIDVGLIQITAHSDAVHVVRSKFAMWSRKRYSVHKTRVIPNGTRKHDEIVEVSNG